MYPPIEPFEHGLLPVTGGGEIYWETSGNPAGSPALYLHGGPGSGLGQGGYRRRFDPAVYRIIGIDQRGCGRSRPLAVDALDRLASNTTAALIDDIEAVRAHLHIERWLISGVSWGTTLALAYAEAHPERVSAMVLLAVTTTSHEEDWITETVGRLFPEAWERFEQESKRRPGERVVEAYARRLAAGQDADDRARAAASWDEWESTHISLDPNWMPGPRHVDPVQRATFATLVTHYWANDGFLSDGNEIVSRLDLIAHIPAVLIHGRRDISGPAITPWRLHGAWPASRLVIVEDEGHGGPKLMEAMCHVLDTFAPAH